MADVADNWPRDADDLVNGIPEHVKAAKSLGMVPAAGNDPEAQRRATKALEGLGIEVPAGLQSGPVTPEDRRNAVRRQNEYAEEAAAALLDSPTPNPVQAAYDAENPEAGAKRNKEDKVDTAASRRAAASTDGSKSTTAGTPTGRTTAPKTTG